jgi:hypothetical protein
MLRLRKGKPPYTAVDLGAGAIMRVRAATQGDVEFASARAQRALLGLAAGSAAASALQGVLGEEFSLEALQHDAGMMTAASRLAEIYLVMSCQDGWDGVVDDDGTPIAAPTAATVALLLNDPVTRRAVIAAVNTRVHEEAAEKNVSAASPNGGAGIPDGAPTAARPENAAPAGSASSETMESQSSAPSGSTLQ